MIDQEIAALTARKQVPNGPRPARWPKRLRLYACCSKDDNYEKGEDLELTGEALRLFAHFEEVSLDVEVAEDGAVTILSCNGHAVVPDARPWVPQMDGDLEATSSNRDGAL